MSKPIEYICIKSGHSAILQRKDNLLLSTEAATQAEAMEIMRQVDPDLSQATTQANGYNHETRPLTCTLAGNHPTHGVS